MTLNYDNSGNLQDADQLTTLIGLTIQTNPRFRGDGSIVHTQNLGEEVGFDNKNGGFTNFVSVIGRKVRGELVLGTIFPGCSID